MMDRINHSFLEAVREWPEEEIRKYGRCTSLPLEISRCRSSEIQVFSRVNPGKLLNLRVEDKKPES